MPTHDWTRVSAGAFHDFHNAWITFLRSSLNGGLLPEGYYALGEQAAGSVGPDVLTLPDEPDDADETSVRLPPETDGGTAVATAPPPVRTVQRTEEEVLFSLRRQRHVAIRHASGDRLIAAVEIVSRANRHTRHTVDRFVDKVVALVTAYVEPTTVGGVLIDLPLFLTADRYVPLPLETTYA